MAQINPNMLTAELVASLTAVDTPTICNALEIATGSRSNKGFTIGAFLSAHPEMKPILGFARTATLRTAVPYTDPSAVLKERRLSWYEHIEGKGVPTISVYQDKLLGVDEELVNTGKMTHEVDLDYPKVQSFIKTYADKPLDNTLMLKGKEAYDMIFSKIANYQN